MMTKAAIAHPPQRVDCAALRRDRDGIRRHRLHQGGHRGILAFGKRTHCIAAGEDAAQALLLVDHQHRAGATLPHAPAGMLHRVVGRQHKGLLVFDNVREFSVGHDPSPNPMAE
jgi:hypothetical protein